MLPIGTRQQWRKFSGWGIPLTYIFVTIAFGLIFPRVEHRLLPDLTLPTSVPAALSICSAVASGMIALTGIVFSLTFVMVQFSATAYSPRLVLWVARDPVVSHALGMFSSTFLYALFVMGWVDRGALGRVPMISGLLVLGSLLASMGMFIALIERLGVLQVNSMLISTSRRGREAIEDLYRPLASTPAADERSELDKLPVTQTVTHSGPPQVIQTIDVAQLVALAKESGAVIEVLVVVGDTPLEATPLLQVRGARSPLDERKLLEAFEMGDERTFEQDPKYAFRLLVDIAIKALSPAINDPTTAVQGLDQIEDLLIRLGRSRLKIGSYRDDQGALRLVVPFPTWEDFLLLALDEIRAYGASSVQVMRRMNALIENLVRVLPQERHEALEEWKTRLMGTINRSFAGRDEKQDASVPDRQGLGMGEPKEGEEKP